MPTFAIKTISAEKIWSKGDVAIYALELDYQGQAMTAKTYSKAIATEGWEGEVETYEKGEDTFVRQPKKEGYAGGGGGYSKGGGRPQADPYTMYLSYAKDLAIAAVDAKGIFSQDLYVALLSAVEAGGAQLYNSRPGAEQTPSKAAEVPPQGKKVIDMKDIEIEDVDKAVDKVFPGAKKGEDEPWNKDKPQLPV